MNTLLLLTLLSPAAAPPTVPTDLPPRVRAALVRADGMDLFSLDADAREVARDRLFRRRATLGKVELSEDERKRVGARLVSSVSSGGPTPFESWVPGEWHGLTVRSGGATFDLVFAFHCCRATVFEAGRVAAVVRVDERFAADLDSLFAASKIPIGKGRAEEARKQFAKQLLLKADLVEITSFRPGVRIELEDGSTDTSPPKELGTVRVKDRAAARRATNALAAVVVPVRHAIFFRTMSIDETHRLLLDYKGHRFHFGVNFECGGFHISLDESRKGAKLDALKEFDCEIFAREGGRYDQSVREHFDAILRTAGVPLPPSGR